ncbi:acyltransferase [uncultured Paracoccus sp.]|uniref:acyltransferase family protein n=1 Tax=uncultured Paracoccus sp. TaxID=189685 RepID=UPI0026155158|nr:acyltransferase [uncultured Paracoccus sp.]
MAEANDGQFPVDTMRAIAALLLVTYHVIGAGPDAGLQIDYPEPLRLFADFLLDLRMPLFAMIAGLVFAIRSPAPMGLPRFFAGKLRRLVVPGIVAMFAFELASSLGHTRLDVHARYLTPFVTGYAHFWFLQSILLIFVVYVPLDSLTGGRIAHYTLLPACFLSLSGFAVPNDPFSIDGAMILLPYFLLGILVWRHRGKLLAHRRRILAGALALLLIGSAWNIQILRETGMFSQDRRDLQSLLSAVGGCLVTLQVLPRLRSLDRIAAMSFTIYLYHVFGTSLMRRLLDSIGYDQLVLQLIAGILAGVALPVAVHTLAERHNLTRVMILGLRPLHSQHEAGRSAPSRAT